jgi:hypothetical protein
MLASLKKYDRATIPTTDAAAFKNRLSPSTTDAAALHRRKDCCRPYFPAADNLESRYVDEWMRFELQTVMFIPRF